MRFKRGSKVEVMDKSGDPVSWHMAEILSVNGHTYDVGYDCYPRNATQPMVERVARKFLRPCPPLMEGLENCTAGSIVEVFDDCSWKIAVILKVLNGDQYLVRLLGCSEELIINRSNTRMRQTWHNDKWILMGQGSRGCDDDGKVSKLLTPDYYQKMRFQGPEVNAMDKNQAQKYSMHIQSDAGVWESHLVSSRSLKRMSPYCSSVVEANNGHVQKIRAIEKEEMKNRVVSGPIIEKVDAVTYPREILGEKNMHASFNRSYGYNQMERPKQNDIYGYCGLRSSEFNNSDSDACSVGSCSVTNHSPNNCYSHIIPLPCQLTDTPGSDAESCYGPGSGCEKKNGLHLPKEEIEASIHRLELHAYRCTLEALYASGPLSWDKEALLTNLRIMLHISNDEHSMELKYLISTKTGPQLEACFNCFQRLNDDVRVTFLLAQTIGLFSLPLSHRFDKLTASLWVAVHLHFYGACGALLTWLALNFLKVAIHGRKYKLKVGLDSLPTPPPRRKLWSGEVEAIKQSRS